MHHGVSTCTATSSPRRSSSAGVPGRRPPHVRPDGACCAQPLRCAQQAHQASGSAQGNSAASPAPTCPRCGKPMVQRIEHDKALGRVMLGLLKDDTEWYEHCRSIKYGPRVMPKTEYCLCQVRCSGEVVTDLPEGMLLNRKSIAAPVSVPFQYLLDQVSVSLADLNTSSAQPTAAIKEWPVIVRSVLRIHSIERNAGLV